MQNVLITISGPSLSGKTTAAQELVKNHGFIELVSTTTRPMRATEQDGREYFFITKDEFQQKEKNGDFVEIVSFNNNMYGVTKEEILKNIEANKNIAVVVEPHGAQQIVDFCAEKNIPYLKIFINNEQELLVERFMERMTGDVKNAINNGTNVKKVFDTYEARLDAMLNIEYKQWVEPALSGKEYYDIILETFKKENTKELIQDIVTKVTQKNSFKNKM